MVLDHFSKKSFHRKILTERPFDRTPFDQKFILPKGHKTEFFFQKMVTESTFDKKCHLTKINRKLRVATEKGSTFFWFSTIYRAAENVQNDYLSSARNFRSIEYHHALYLNFGTLAGLWPWAIGPSLKIEVLGFFIITMKFLIHRV
jgi:hypothetical protein